MDLSAPEGHSVNDFIDKALCSLSYVSVDDVANTVLLLGRGALLAKTDVKEAFRIIPVDPTDRLLLAMQWKGQLFIDKVLPFGLRSAPLLFAAVADAIEWIIREQGVEHIFHYIDDFILAGPPGSQQCTSAMATTLQIFADLGVPVEPNKCEGPATVLTGSA